MAHSLSTPWISDLLSDAESSDVQLVVQNGSVLKRISAHKLILSSVSPVFKAMFTHDFQENKTGEVRINDHSFDAMKFLVDYIYSGFFGRLKMDLALAVHSAAHYYQIKPLVVPTEQYIQANITKGSVVSIFKAPKLRDVGLIQKMCLDLMVKTKRSEIRDFDSLDKEDLLKVFDSLDKEDHAVIENPKKVLEERETPAGVSKRVRHV